MMGGDENSAQDVGQMNESVRHLIEHTGACVLLVHHSGKNKAAGARGSSALLGAIDTELEVDENQVIARKQRDVELADPIGFALKPVMLGVQDEDGEEMTSCVVEPAAAGSDSGAPLTPKTRRAFEVLCDMAPDNQPVPISRWRDQCIKEDACKNSAFYDARRALRRAGKTTEEDGCVTRRME